MLRPLVVASGVAVAMFLIASGKGYYTAGLLPVVFAAGAVASEAILQRSRRARPRMLLALTAVLAPACCSP